jgi:hypothetical protein
MHEHLFKLRSNGRRTRRCSGSPEVQVQLAVAHVGWAVSIHCLSCVSTVEVTCQVQRSDRESRALYFLLYSMTNDGKYKLTCLVEGDRNAFPIVISRGADIDQLTDLFYERRKKGLFRDIDPADLALLKVCKFLSHSCGR